MMEEFKEVLSRIDKIIDDPEIYGDNLDEIARDAWLLATISKNIFESLTSKIDALEKRVRFLEQKSFGDPGDE